MIAAILSMLIGIAFLGAVGEAIRFLARRHAEGLRRELPASYNPWLAIRPQLGVDTPGGCLHLKPEPVIITGETEPVGWICSDCLVDLANDDQAVVARKATDLKKALRDDANRKFKEMFMPPSLAERERAARYDELKERLLRQEKVIYGGESEFIEIRDAAGNVVRRVEY